MPLHYKQLSPLTEDFKPPQLLYRDSQLSELFKYVQQNQNVWMEGGTGLGKTVTCKVFSEEIEVRNMAKVFYFRCQPSIKDAIYAGQHYYDLRIPRREICGGRFALEIVANFPDVPRYVLILDEPERVRMWRKDIPNFVHTFWNEMMDGQHKPFSIIFISQQPLMTKIERSFPSATLSRLKLKPIQFGIYPEEQIIGILKQRLQYVLDKSMYSDEPLQILAKHIYRIGGNLREALDLLIHAINIADTALTPEIITSTIDWGKNQWWTRKLRQGLNSPHTALLLYLTATLSEQKKSLTVGCPAVIQLYKEITNKLNRSPLSFVTLYSNFKTLVQEGVFTTEYETDKAFYMKLTFLDEGDRDWIVRVGKEIDWSELLEEKQSEIKLLFQQFQPKGDV